MQGGGVTKGGVAYSYAGPATVDTAKGGGFTQGGVAYSYGPGPTISQPPASRSANPQHYPSQNYHSGYGAPSEVIYHYAHGHSTSPHTLPPPPPQYAPPQYAPPQYAPPQCAPPQYASPQYAPPRDAPLQYAHPPVYHPARGGRVSSGRVVSSGHVETTNHRVETPPLLPGARGPSWPQGPPAPQGLPRQDTQLQYTPQQDAPPQAAPLQHTPRHDDTYDHAAVRAAAGRAAVGRAAAVHTTPGTIAQVAPPPPPPPVARMRIGGISSRVVGVTLRHVNGREAAEMVSSHDRAHASGEAVAPDDLARFQQRLGLSARQPRVHHAPPSPQQQQHHHHTPQHYMPQYYMHHTRAPLEGRVLPATLGDPHDVVSLADALAASSEHARASQQPTRPPTTPEAHPLAQGCLVGAAQGCRSALAPCPKSPISPRRWLISTQACDLCERLAASIAEVSPGFSTQAAEPPLEPQVGA